ncbi:aldose 1-epimerase family protein [Edaphobacter bradus]|uniref:aldose 1-epimerase family protein n=1 Tax=Edaphobacter bradus TaxID=2259016 RepID=UPI0021E03E7A|nr:aldose 1-epimerase family protein [Edaphobacter bradus]
MSSNNRYRLTSSELAAEIVPSEGGRIASIKSLSSGVEFLTQSRHEASRIHENPDASFRNGPCAGIEECLPTVGPSGPETSGGSAPDHGDFWQLGWTVLRSNKQALTEAAIGFSRPLRFEKSVSVNGSQLRLAYSIQNVAETPQSFLYACHPLFAVAPGDEIFLPAEVDSLRLDYSRADRLGQPGDMVSWPVTQQGIRLDRAGGEHDGTAEMLYTRRLTEGRCRIYRAASRQSLEVHFDTQALPYLGIWLCYGGWPEGEREHLQYAVALEPTSSPHNTLARAQRDGSAIALEPQESFRFEITLGVTGPEPDAP